ncbi:MAG: carboxypeptidase regulatory-like domain-containing protein [Polyangiaceae bacterium]
MKRFLFPSLAFASASALFVACGTSDRPAVFDDGGDPNGSDGSTSTGNDGSLFGDAGGGGPAGCVGLECSKPTCSGQNTTTLTGKVFAPNGRDPLYNVLVYVPNGDLKAFDDGVTCETCEKSVSGNPIATALTDTQGRFELKDMPAGKDIPIVVQIGRFRRKVTLPAVDACVENKAKDGDLRLPKNASEGDIPRIAIVTSTYDPTECILNEIGIDAAEFTAPSGPGRIHVFRGNGNTVSGATTGAELWSNAATLKKYQLVALPCSSYPSDATSVQNLFDYANVGGRIFATDLSYPVIASGRGDWPQTGNYTNPGSFSNPAQIDTSFPKGKALADWLQGLGATTGPQLSLTDTYSRVGIINPPAQRWLYSGSTNTQAYTFNTPTTAAEKDQCGRVYYSSFHIGTGRSLTGTFPGACQAKPLTAQERVLEFMLFDLASCVQSDKEPPAIPK